RGGDRRRLRARSDPPARHGSLPRHAARGDAASVMLLYLDNAGSAGPNSPIGLRRHLGLNENLARESLELHTVSPASGYTQADVTTYAKVLTGWSVSMAADQPGFTFHPNQHEPGALTVMGRGVPEGEAGGVAMLAFL